MQKLNTKSFHFEENGQIPNNPTLPLLLYQQVFEGGNIEQQFEEAFSKNQWGGSWVNGMYDYHHYHSTAHEVLGVISGSATLIFGGPGGEEAEVKAGDMVVIPAGTGHCRKSASPDFKVIGAYPQGQENYDLCTEKNDIEEKKKNIRKVALPKADPVGGEEGPLMGEWNAG